MTWLDTRIQANEWDAIWDRLTHELDGYDHSRIASIAGTIADAGTKWLTERRPDDVWASTTRSCLVNTKPAACEPPPEYLFPGGNSAAAAVEASLEVLTNTQMATAPSKDVVGAIGDLCMADLDEVTWSDHIEQWNEWYRLEHEDRSPLTLEILDRWMSHEMHAHKKRVLLSLLKRLDINAECILSSEDE